MALGKKCKKEQKIIVLCQKEKDWENNLSFVPSCGRKCWQDSYNGLKRYLLIWGCWLIWKLVVEECQVSTV